MNIARSISMSAVLRSERLEWTITTLGASAAYVGLVLVLWATWDRQNGFIYLFLPLVLGTAAPLLSMLVVAYITARRARSALQLRLHWRLLLQLGAFVAGVVVPLLFVVTYRTLPVAVAGIVFPAFFLEQATSLRFIGIYALPFAILVLELIVPMVRPARQQVVRGR
jgi:hypothetical protein